MKVTLINHTEDAENLLLFAKNTRLLSDATEYHSLSAMTEQERDEGLDHVFTTIGGSWEFIDYVFLIEEVSRAFTHQLVRQRVGVSFAQQSQRYVDMSNFDYVEPELSILQNNIYRDSMERAAHDYSHLISLGVNTQDARGVLPTNICTNILIKINLRALSELTSLRLCVRSQGEYQKIAKKMADIVSAIHPFAERVLGPKCVVQGVCAFPRFNKCPIKAANPSLQHDESKLQSIRDSFKKYCGHSPQPK